MTDSNAPPDDTRFERSSRRDRPPRPRGQDPLAKGREILQQRPHFHFTYLLLALLGVFLLHDIWVSMQEVEHIPYSEFQKVLDDGEVSKVVVQGDIIRGEFKKPHDGKTYFVTNLVDPNLAKTLEGKHIVFSSQPESTFLPTLLSWLLPIGLFFAVWMFLMRRMSGRLGGPGGGLMSIGKSNAKVYVESDTGVSFSDVAGVDEAKEELEEVVNFLKEPSAYGRLGARMPKGVLLVGPPGTGKTLLARAVAGEASVPFFSISGSEFVEMFVGVGAARVRDLFEQARKQAPAIIFIDELDALGRARGGLQGFGGHDEKEQTLNQLLVELDGFDPTVGIVLLAATNRPEVLDPALLRAGRFDRQVLVDRPDRLARVAILDVHLRRVTTAPDVDPEQIAALTPGFTGADLANLVNEAALVATRRSSDSVAMADFTLAIERIVAGLEKRNRLLNPREREVVAHHEMGHALVAAAMPSTDPVHKVSIIPRGIGALGYTLQRPTEDRYLMTRGELEQKLSVLLGGRAAEQIMYGEVSTGAADDLGRATDIARTMATQYAMVPELGNATYAEESAGFLGGPGSALHTRRYSEETAREIDCAVRAIVDTAFDRARAVLEHNRPVLEESARALLERETLSEAELRPFFEKVELPEPLAGASPTA
jgi:cell division protease FtsH